MFCEIDFTKKEIVELISFAVHHEKGNRLKEASHLYGLAGAKAYQLSSGNILSILLCSITFLLFAINLCFYCYYCF